VLCIDDRPQMLELRKATLESRGYCVKIALSGYTAIKMLEETSVAGTHSHTEHAESTPKFKSVQYCSHWPRRDRAGCGPDYTQELAHCSPWCFESAIKTGRVFTRGLISCPTRHLVLSDNPVALAGGVFKFLAVHNLHCATGVLDELLLLQNTGCQAHSRSICP